MYYKKFMDKNLKIYLKDGLVLDGIGINFDEKYFQILDHDDEIYIPVKNINYIKTNTSRYNLQMPSADSGEQPVEKVVFIKKKKTEPSPIIFRGVKMPQSPDDAPEYNPAIEEEEGGYDSFESFLEDMPNNKSEDEAVGRYGGIQLPEDLLDDDGTGKYNKPEGKFEVNFSVNKG